MAVEDTMDPSGVLGKHLEQESPDLLRALVAQFVAQLMGEEVDALCGAGYGERSPERVNSRNGYRSRDWDTRAGTIELAIPKLRSGSYFPDWLLDRRRRAEQALISVVATSYVLGVSTRRVENLVQALGIEGISKSQVSRMAKVLDAEVEAFRTRPLDASPYTYVWMDALTMKVREGGRVVNASVLIATGVNAEGTREILGLDLVTSEDGAGWLAFCRSLVARGPPMPTIMITGSRDSADTRYVKVSGTTTDLVGKQVTPWVRFPGQSAFSAGTGVRTVNANGSFAWQRKTGKKIYVYFQHEDVKSNTVTISAR